MIQDVLGYLAHALRRPHGFFNVYGADVGVMDMLFFLNCVDKINSEGQDIAVINGVDNGIGVQFFAKRLRRGV